MVEMLQLQAFAGLKPARRRPMVFKPQMLFMAARQHERRQVLAETRTALHDRQLADAHELMHQAIAGNKCSVLNLHVAPQQRRRWPRSHDRPDARCGLRAS